jgi:HEAT repeat protein
MSIIPQRSKIKDLYFAWFDPGQLRLRIFKSATKSLQLSIPTLIALAALGPIPASAENREVQELKRQMQSSSVETRRGAIWMLARMGAPASEAIPDLIAALQDENRSVQIQAVSALDRIGAPEGQQAIEKKMPEIIEFIRNQLGQPGDLEKALSSISLLGSRTSALEEDLLKLAPAIDESLRGRLLSTLATIGGARTRRFLAETASDEKSELGEDAVSTLASFGAVALPDLKQMLKSNSVEIKYRALIGLYALKDAAAPEEAGVLAALAVDDPRVRIYACRTLKNLKSTKATDALLRMALPPDGQISFEAAEALAQIPGEKSAQGYANFREAALPLIIRKISDTNGPDRPWAIDEASRLGLFTTDVVAAIVAALDDRARETRLSAIRALSQNGDVAHIPLYSKALGDSDVKVRFAASNALTRLGGLAVPSLIDSLGKGQPRVRRHMAILTLDLLGSAASAADSDLAALSNDDDLLISLAAKSAHTHIREAVSPPAG